MCTWRDKTDTHAQNKHSWLNRRLCHLILYNPSQNVAEEQAKLLKERGKKKKGTLSNKTFNFTVSFPIQSPAQAPENRISSWHWPDINSTECF